MFTFHRCAALVPFLLLVLTACAPPRDASTGQAPDSAAKPPPAPLADVAPGDLEALKARVQAHVPGLQIDAVRPTPVEGLFEVQSGFGFGYVSADGRYLIEGDLSDLISGERLTDNRRRTARAELIAGLSADQTIDYAPAKDKTQYTVTVFTDIDCGYCRKLHQHIAEYNADGIAVRYVFFPRSGPQTESFYKAEKVWCAADRGAALTQAKLGQGFEGPKDCKNPVMDHLRLAAQLGLRGTPAIVLPDGEIIPGYQAPAELLKALSVHGTPPAG